MENYLVECNIHSEKFFNWIVDCQTRFTNGLTIVSSALPGQFLAKIESDGRTLIVGSYSDSENRANIFDRRYRDLSVEHERRREGPMFNLMRKRRSVYQSLKGGE